MSDTTNIFNGTSEVGGVFEAFSKDQVLVTIARAKGDNAGKETDLNDGFLASGYRINFQRNVQPRRFLNNTSTFFNVGYGVGTLQLDGIVGKKSAFDKLLSNGNEDVCNPLIISVFPSFFHNCLENGGQEASEAAKSLKYICGNCMAQTVALTGQVDQHGIVLNTGTLVFQIGSLKTTTGSVNKAGLTSAPQQTADDALVNYSQLAE
jgi:hypothetical protein